MPTNQQRGMRGVAEPNGGGCRDKLHFGNCIAECVLNLKMIHLNASRILYFIVTNAILIGPYFNGMSVWSSRMGRMDAGSTPAHADVFPLPRIFHPGSGQTDNDAKCSEMDGEWIFEGGWGPDDMPACLHSWRKAAYAGLTTFIV